MFKKRLSLLVVLAVAATLISVTSIDAAKKPNNLFVFLAEGGHVKDKTRDEVVTTYVRITNRSTTDPIQITSVQIIRRSDGADVTDLTASTCLFNGDSSVLSFATPLPVTLQPVGVGFSSLSFSSSRCNSDTRRETTIFQELPEPFVRGGTEKDVAGFTTIITITAENRSHIGCRFRDIRRVNEIESEEGRALLSEIRSDCVVSP